MQVSKVTMTTSNLVIAPKDLADFIKSLMDNEAEYQSYFAWRQLDRSLLQTPKTILPRKCKYCEYDNHWPCKICMKIKAMF